jgi:hypothetical protein
MKRTLLLALLLPAAARADELSVYYLSNLAVQYEGTGFRESPGGWELKVKPKAGGQGLRWRHGRGQVQYWRNDPYYSSEAGNSASLTLHQYGETLYGYQTLVADLRLPLAGSALEAVGGAQGTRVVFKRKAVVFKDVPTDETPTEVLEALGPVVGLHAEAEKPLRGAWGLWADGEILTGHFFWTRNRQKSFGGSLHRDGYSYIFRAEAGVRCGGLRLGLGLARQAAEIVVPGGRALPNGGAASLPINQNDFDGSFISVSWVWP